MTIGADDWGEEVDGVEEGLDVLSESEREEDNIKAQVDMDWGKGEANVFGPGVRLGWCLGG